MRAASFTVGLLALLVAVPASATAATTSYSEDFTSTEYRSPQTTAWWDTTASGALKLYPFEPNLLGDYDTPVSAQGVCVEGDFVFVTDGLNGLIVLDISIPSIPILEGSVDTPDWAQKVTVAGDHAYVADASSGLAVVDISDPSSPVLVGGYDTAGSATDVAVAGNYAFVADFDQGLQVVDISDPGSPTYGGGYVTPGNSWGVAVAGNYAFMADYYGGLQVVDISDPTSPTSAGSYDTTPGAARGVAVTGDHAYVANGSTGLKVIDISDPTSPTLAASYDTPGDAYSVAISGDFAYVADGSGGLLLFDISDPTSPDLIETLATPDVAWEAAVSGGWTYVADGSSGLQVFETSLPVLPILAGGSGSPSLAQAVAVSGDLACVGDWSDGLLLIDISDPTSPTVLGASPTSYVNDIAVAGNTAYMTRHVTSASYDLVAYDISDPTNPGLIGGHYWFTVEYVGGLAIDGDYAYVMRGGILDAVDIGDPTTPAPAGSLLVSLDKSLEGIAVAGDHAYVAASSVWGSELIAVDISDPTNMAVAGTTPTLGAAHDVALSGDHAFVAVGDSGLQVFDISNPSSPVSVGDVDSPGSTNGVAVSGNRAFVAVGSAGGSGLHVFDTTDPTNPALLGSLTEGFGAGDVAVAGDHVYLTAGSSGLQVAQVFHHYFRTDWRKGQSLVISDYESDIYKARLTSVQVGGVTWELSPDGGANWVDAPQDVWVEVPAAGSNLVWKSTHIPSVPDQNPMCLQLGIEWLYHCAPIDTIADVPGDQGGWARLQFSRSAHDDTAEPDYPIVAYDIHRRVDDLALSKRVLMAGQAPREAHAGALPGLSKGATNASSGNGLRTLALGDQRFVMRDSSGRTEFPPGVWETVATVHARQEESYTVLVPTVADSGVDFRYSVYVTTAHTSVPAVWFVCVPDSGYSIDNIAPSVPTGFSVDYSASENRLQWDSSPDIDFQHFNIYRGTDPEFIPGQANLTHSTIDTEWLDMVDDGWQYYYRIAAVDFVGNESGYASPELVTSIEEPGLPAGFALYQSTPNPLNRGTQIRYDVPVGGGEVVLEVFDVSGRMVRRLVSRYETPGRKSVEWDGRNWRGVRVASGVYYYRLKAPAYERTLKTTVLR